MYKILNQLVFCISVGAINLYCSKDEVQVGFENFLLGEINGNNQCQIIEDPKPLELLKSIPFTSISENAKLIYSSSDKENDLKQIFQDQDQFLFQSNDIHLNIFENSDVEVILNIKKFFRFQLQECDNILKEYFILTTFMVFCENDNSYKIYQFQEKLNELNQLEFIFDKHYELNKTMECKIDVSQDISQYIFFSYFECQTWKIYMIYIDVMSLIYDSTITNNDEILRNIQIDQKNILIFDHQIYKFELPQLTLKMIYENEYEKILAYENSDGFQYIVTEFSEKLKVLEQQENEYIIRRLQKPIQIIKIREKPLLNFGSYLEVVRDNQKQPFILKVPSGILLTQKFSPYLILLSKNLLTILKQNKLYLKVECNQYKNLEVINLIASSNTTLQNCTLSVVKQISEKDLLNFDNIQLQKEIINLKFQIEFNQQILLMHGLIPNLSIYDNNFIMCKQNVNLIEIDCINPIIKKSIWWIMKVNLDEKIFIYQVNDQSIEILECSINKITKIIIGEVIQLKNIFNYPRFVFLVYSQNYKILRIDTNDLKNMKSKFNFKTQIINILYINSYQVLIILDNCQSYVIQKNFIAQYYYFNLDPYGKCIQPKKMITTTAYYSVIKNNIFQLHKRVFTISFKLEVQDILEIVEINNLFFMILSQQNKEFIFSKYTLTINQEFFKLFDFPHFIFKFHLPLKYEICGYTLVVAASSKNESTQVLLVYYLKNDQYNSLIDVIKVDNFQFTLVSELRLLIFQNQKYFLYDLARISFNCSIDNFIEYEISKPLYVKLHSKINPEIAVNSSIKLKLLNQIESLQIINQTFIKMTFDNPNILISLDPRIYILGSLVNITSQDIVIEQPLLQSKPTFFNQCHRFYNTVCFNKKESYIILDIFSNNQRKIIVNEGIKNIFKGNNVYFFLYQNDFVIVFHKENNQIIQNIDLKNYLCIEISDIIMINNIIIFQCTNKLLIYLMKPLYLEFIDEIQNELDFQEYKFVGIQNQQGSFLIYNLNNSTFWVITIQERQDVLEKSKFILQLTSSNKQFISYLFPIDFVQDIQIRFNQMEIIYIQLINDSYYEFKYLIIQDNIATAYVMICQIEKNFNQILKLQKLGIIRLPKIKPNFNEIIKLSDDQFLLADQETNSPLSLSIYNISEINKFNLVDRIFNIELNATLEKQGLQIYNQTHFIYPQLNNQYEVCSIQPYQLNISIIRKQPITIIFQNQVSNISLQLILQNSVNNQSNIQFVILWIGSILLLILLCLFCLQVRGKQKKKAIINLEIEL